MTGGIVAAPVTNRSGHLDVLDPASRGGLVLRRHLGLDSVSVFYRGVLYAVVGVTGTVGLTGILIHIEGGIVLPVRQGVGPGSGDIQVVHIIRGRSTVV